MEMLRGDQSGGGGGLYPKAGGEHTYDWNVAFVENNAGGLGGARGIEDADLLQVSYAMFKSNEASLGCAVYINVASVLHNTPFICTRGRPIQHTTRVHDDASS